MIAASSAPHILAPEPVSVMMRRVIFSLAPALCAFAWFFGPGIIFNFAVATAVAILTEYLCLKLRRRPVRVFIDDHSAIVTALLLAFCLPSLTPWWITAIGTVFAIAFAKHLYGGLGYNIFNPAMAGYLLILVSFPEELTRWPSPQIGDLDYEALSLFATLRFTLTGNLPDSATIDALTRATPLDTVKIELGMMRTMGEIRANPLFGDFGGRGWEWIANFIALGGFWLLYKGVIRWHIPAAMLGGLLGTAFIFYLLDSATHPSPGFHLFTGASVLCAFYIATDPVSAATTNIGRFIYGAGIGILTYVLRTWGSYPDGVAFAVLLMNMTVPIIDRFTRPRVYGRGRRAGVAND